MTERFPAASSPARRFLRRSSRPSLRRRVAGRAALTLTVGIAALLSAGCQPPEPERPDLTKPFALSYTLEGPSIPPRYRRDVELLLADRTMTVNVTSYGKQVAVYSKTVDPAVLGEVRRTLDGLPDINAVLTAPGCTGGSANALTVRMKDRIVIRRTVERCGDTHVHEFERNELVVEPLLALLGDRDKAFRVGEIP
jgi:hypothetical protein